MTLPVALHDLPAAPAISPAPAHKTPLPLLYISSLFLFFLPRPIARRWTHATLRQAIIVGLINSLLAVAWLFVIIVAFHICLAAGESTNRAAASSPPALQASFREAAAVVAATFTGSWKDAQITDKFAGIIGALLLWIGTLLLPFFVLLPFAARPGSNRACARHVARTVLLGTGAIHFCAAAITAFLLIFPRFGPHTNGPLVDPTDVVAPFLCLFIVLGLWTLLAFVAAVRQEYRRPADFPQPTDPYCDQCGYILIAADPAGRCPECGRLVRDSLGPQTRPPTAWEQHPSFRNVPAIMSQIKSLFAHPRDLFFAMPTLTGQRAAQHWLTGSMVIVALLAAATVPAIRLVLPTMEWSFVVVIGSLAMALIWATLALMMVGIETAGVALFSHMRGHRVPLAASAKVTAYASALMWPWVVLGGIQLIWTIHWLSNPATMSSAHIVRDQILLAGTVAAAHIGGLLHFEFTVYRGVRAIQFANR